MKTDAGAVGDGKTDDTKAFQAVFGAGKHKPHDRFGAARRIYIPPGTYLLRDTIRWGDKKKFVRGSGTERTILRLADGAFADQQQKSYFLDVKGDQFMAQNFGQRLLDLTIEIGADNPQTIAVGYHTNNDGALANIVIRSRDPEHRGLAGIDLYGNTGPGLCWNIEIEGFDYGVLSQSHLHSMTLGRLTFRQQRKAAILNDRQSLFISHVVSENRVPFLLQGTKQGGGMVTLVQARLRTPAAKPPALPRTDSEDANQQFESQAADADHTQLRQVASPAIIADEGSLLLRDIFVDGYSAALKYRQQQLPAGKITVWGVPKMKGIQDGKVRNLSRRLPPTPEYGDPETWTVIPPGTSQSGLQSAIDQGSRIIFVPPKSGLQLNHTVRINEDVDIVHGFGTICRTGDGFVRDQPMSDPLWEGKWGKGHRDNRSEPVWRVSAESERPLHIQFLGDSYGQAGWGVDHASSRELVLWACHATYRNTVPGGTVFLLDVGGAPFHFKRNTAYVWQLNTESYNWNPHVLNEGGKLWICGHKTEKDRTNLATIDGGWTELNGAWYMKNRERVGETAMIKIRDSDFSGAFTNSYQPYETLLDERQETQHRQVRMEDHGRSLGLYYSFKQKR